MGRVALRVFATCAKRRRARAPLVPLTPSATPIAAATPIAGAPRITIVRIASRHCAIVLVNSIDLAARKQPLIYHPHAVGAPFNGLYCHSRLCRSYSAESTSPRFSRSNADQDRLAGCGKKEFPPPAPFDVPEGDKKSGHPSARSGQAFTQVRRRVQIATNLLCSNLLRQVDPVRLQSFRMPEITRAPGN